LSLRTSTVGSEAKPQASDGEVLDARTFANALESWFSSNGRDLPWRCWTDEYRVVVVELLLQRTRATTVAGFVDAFFHRYPTWSALARAQQDELESALKPIGLYQRRARVLRELAIQAQGEADLPAEGSPGVGQYIARAVRVVLRQEKLAMVDSNWVRVLHRVHGGQWMADYRYDDRLQSLAKEIVQCSTDSPRVNWAVLDLGSTVCLPRKPRCEICPLRRWCTSAQLRSGQSG